MAHLLSSNVISGTIGLVFLFLFCFLAVHAPAILKKIKKKPPQTPPPPAPKIEEEQTPIYYIVEKKKRRIKEDYSAPKEIKFK